MYDNTPSIIRWDLEENIDAHETCGIKYFYRMVNRLQTPHQSGPVLIADLPSPSIPDPITILSLYYYQLRAVSLPLVDLVPILPSEKQLTEGLELALTGDGRSKKVTSG